MHAEFIEIGKETADAVNRAKRENRRVVAVGTTVVRTLEWAYAKQGEIAPFRGMCDTTSIRAAGSQLWTAW